MKLGAATMKIHRFLASPTFLKEVATSIRRAFPSRAVCSRATTGDRLVIGAVEEVAPGEHSVAATVCMVAAKGLLVACNTQLSAICAISA